MSRKVRIRILGSFEMASRAQAATVIIDRDTRSFSVRPLRSRRLYTTRLADVAERLVRETILGELIARRKAAKAHRRK